MPDSATPVETLTIDVYSDVVCPWCWIGKRRLERVLLGMPEIDVALRWQPFRLRPDMLPEGEAWIDVVNTKFGGAERAREMFAHVAAAGRSEGLTFDFERITRAPQTMDAHRLIVLAESFGLGWKLSDELFRAYFTNGQDVSDRNVLTELAAGAGLEADTVRVMLEADTHRDTVLTSQVEAGRLGIRGVPFFVLDGRLGISGAQPPEVFVQGIRQALAG
jgi:predicted DsbA family dithiol-disulfide isomerase